MTVCPARWFSAVIIAIGISFCVVQAQIPFYYDFNRPNNAMVGNGWSDVVVPAPYTGTMQLSSGAAALLAPDAFAGIYRAIDFTEPLTVRATFSQTSGFGGTLNRFGNSILLGPDGVFLNGYSLNFYRGDQNYNNSTVSLYIYGGSNTNDCYFY